MSYTFKGFPREDGSVGTRNYIGVVSSVICSSTVVRDIAGKIPSAVPFIHGNGCAQIGDDFQLTKNVLMGVTKNPNLYSSLLVGLGCETNQVSGMMTSLPKTKPLKGITIQGLAGGENTINQGIDTVEKWAEQASFQSRETMPLSALNLGVLCIDLDKKDLNQFRSLIGKLIDKLIDADVTITYGFSKTLEPAGKDLAERAKNTEDKKNLHGVSEGMKRERWKKIKNEGESINQWTKEEAEAAAKEAELTGTKPINSVLSYGDYPKENGLHLLHVPDNIVEALSGMASAGCGAALVISSRGIFTGSVAMPSIMIAPSSEGGMYDELIDYKISSKNVETQMEDITETIINVCSGQKSSIENLDLGEFSISHSGTPF